MSTPAFGALVKEIRGCFDVRGGVDG